MNLDGLLHRVRAFLVGCLAVVLSTLCTSALANSATASADQASASAEDLVVLRELNKVATSTQNEAQASTQDKARNLPTSERPAIASDKLILNSPIIDEAHVLTQSEKNHLENQLRQIHSDKLAQMAVVIIPTTNGQNIFDYAIATANRWGLGNKDTDEGILMLVAINDRNLYIVTGYGVEGVLPDAIIKRIIREDITPAFKSGQYAQGISAGIARIDERLRADPETLKRADKASGDTNPAQEIGLAVPFIIALVVGTLLTVIFGRLLGSVFGASGFVILAFMMGAPLILALFIAFILWILLLMGGVKLFVGGGRGVVIGGGSGGFGGGFGGGGFSGGGGGFGGGGAGGSW